MTTDTTSAQPDREGDGSLYDSKPRRKSFSKRHDQPRLTAEQSVRQGRAVSAALKSLAAADAMAFLNSDQDGLGRPIDLAVESDAGLASVERLLLQRAAAVG